jgi:peptidoglycan/xylan/chitin deacetylase (PgdA/CDA1 family)
MTNPRSTARTRHRVVVGTAGLAVLVTAAAIAAPCVAAASASIVNPSLEQDVDRNDVPDCFTTAGWGTNTATFGRVRQPKTGTWAERLTITSYTDGDRKLIPTMAPGCAPSVTPGQRYTASVWFKSTVWSVMVVYVLRPGGWEYWTQGPSLAPTTGYRQSALDLPPVPADGTAVTFGQTIESNGTIVTDDYALTALGPPPTTTTTTATTRPPSSTATTSTRPGSTTTAASTTTTTRATTTTTTRATTTTTSAPVPCRSGYVALGFDDGPDVYSDQLLDIFEAKQAKASHFLIGNKITPDLAPVVARMVRLGHVVGNHSWTHPYLTQLTDDEIRSELTQTTDRLVAVGVPRPDLWRPPYEDVDARVASIATSLGLSEVLWDLDTNDWQGITPEETTRRIVDGARAGTVVLLHERIANTVAAMPATIDGLRARGFCLGRLRASPTYNDQTRSYAEVVP